MNPEIWLTGSQGSVAFVTVIVKCALDIAVDVMQHAYNNIKYRKHTEFLLQIQRFVSYGYIALVALKVNSYLVSIFSFGVS